MKYLISIFLLILLFCSCQKDDYYIDGGRANPNFDGTIMAYLDAHPAQFDTIAAIIRLAELDTLFEQEEITFFAPPDESIKRLIGDINNDASLNALLYRTGKDTVAQLSDIDGEIWRFFLLRHVFRGKNLLADYPQLDLNVRSVFPGQNYYNYGGEVCNIGVNYGDAGGVRYGGYRQLVISYIPDVSAPLEGWYSELIASSDIQPRNGVVHALRMIDSRFGFIEWEVINTIFQNTP